MLFSFEVTASTFISYQARKNQVANLRLNSFFESQIKQIKSQMRLYWSQFQALNFSSTSDIFISDDHYGNILIIVSYVWYVTQM